MTITYLATIPSAPPSGGNIDPTWPVLIVGTVCIAAIAASAARELVAGQRPALAVRHLMGVVFIVVPTTITVAWVSGGVAVLVCLIVPPTTYVIAAFAGAWAGVAHNLRVHGVPLAPVALVPVTSGRQR